LTKLRFSRRIELAKEKTPMEIPTPEQLWKEVYLKKIRDGFTASYASDVADAAADGLRKGLAGTLVDAEFPEVAEPELPMVRVYTRDGLLGASRTGRIRAYYSADGYYRPIWTLTENGSTVDEIPAGGWVEIS
jgi:hypothetical protein